MDEQQSREFGEYLAILRRRRGQILGIAAVLAALAVTIAVGLPPTYRSSATILVQEQEVPPDLVRSTITSFADERISVISQQVMTRAVLLQLVEKYGLYERERNRLTSEEILEKMRKDIKLSTVNADITDRRSGSRVNATIAFRLSYDEERPDRAQKVVNDLVSLYLNENLKVRQQRAAETTAFLVEEADRVAKQLQQMDAKIAQFKRRNAGRLPDSNIAVQLSDRAESELIRVERELSTLQDRQMALEAQLPLIRPNAPPSALSGPERAVDPVERLRALQAQYSSLSAVYGADHPDVRRTERELEALKAETGVKGDDSKTAEKLKEQEAALVVLKEKYSDDHPEVVKLRRSIAALQQSQERSAAAAKSPSARGGRTLTPDGMPVDNPLYVTYYTQLESTKREIAQLQAARQELRSKIASYDAKLMRIPELELELRDMTRDYENAQTRYREVKAKQMQAEVAQELEKDRKAERFTLIEPPQLPEKPQSPNRLAIVLIGLVVSLGGGFGYAGLKELLDPSVKGPDDLIRVAPVPMLTALPYVQTEAESEAERRRFWIVTGVVAAAIVAFLLGIHFFLKPLPVIWDSAFRRAVFW